METEYHPAEREILPKDLKEFFAKARVNTYAGNAKSIDTPRIPYAKELPFTEEGSKYFYYDSYLDDPNRPGNFFGEEIINQKTTEDKPVAQCTYGGGLTQAGLELGEGSVYGRLQKFLKDEADKVRFGNKVKTSFSDEKGTWVYEDEGKVSDWGWYGTENIYHNGILVYQLIYTGGCFLPNF